MPAWCLFRRLVLVFGSILSKCYFPMINPTNVCVILFAAVLFLELRLGPEVSG